MNLDLNISETNYSENFKFIIGLIKDLNISNIDFLACNSLNYDLWKKYYQILTIKNSNHHANKNQQNFYYHMLVILPLILAFWMLQYL